MVEIKRRRKCKDNPYTLVYNFEKEQYMVVFKSIHNKNEKVIINEEIFNLMNKFELEDISQMHKYERHIEHSELYEGTLYSRITKKEDKIIDIIIKKENFEKLYYAISKLSNKQKRRLILYYFYENTLDEIARKEDCSVHSIFISIERAKENIKKYLI